MTPSQKLLPAVLGLIVFCASCVKDPGILPPPVHFPIPIVEQTPFKSFIDSVQGLENTSLGLIRVTIVSPFFPHAQIPGQAIIGYGFRSSVAGKVTSLGTLLPEAGFAHSVMLWDSLNFQLLAQADVPSLDSGKFTYVSLAYVNQAVDIQPNHPYIVTFNSLANGSALNTYSPGNNNYELNGIYHFFQGGNSLDPIVPFTQGAITFESCFFQAYNNILSPFTPAQLQGQTNLSTLGGICDIGFTPK